MSSKVILTSDRILDALFPIPTSGSTLFATTMHAGASHETAKTLVKLLRANHDVHHIFFNDRGMHNHAAHHMFSIWTLGAPPSLLEAAYQTHIPIQRPVLKSPDITQENWMDHFQDLSYYRGYLKFFTEIVMREGISSACEKLIFAKESNIVQGLPNEKQPRMLNRFMCGLLHPFLHAGYAAEFNTPGMLVEALAMTALTEADAASVVPDELFTESSIDAISKLTATLSLDGPTKAISTGTDCLTLLARMARDPALASERAYTMKVAYSNESFAQTTQSVGKLIWKYVEEWNLNIKNENDLKARLEELSWLVTIIYGVGGLQVHKEFSATFFYMHIVTSSLFSHSYAKILSPASQSVLLRVYLGLVFTMWIGRGRAPINIKNFYESTASYLQLPSITASSLKPHSDALASENLIQNPWFSILQSTLQHPDDHLPKIQRTLSLYSTWYGTREKGYWKPTEGGLEGVELLDGTLFTRVAALTANYVGWVREGQPKRGWAFELF